MGVEHVEPRLMLGEGYFENTALRLAHHHCVDGAVGRLQCRAMVVEFKKIAVKVEGIDRIELGDIDEVDSYRAGLLDSDRLLEICEWDRVDGVEFVFVVKIRVECVHYHDHFLPARILRRAKQA